MTGRDSFFLRPCDTNAKSRDHKTKCEPIFNEKFTNKTPKSEDDKVKATGREKVHFDKKKYRLKKYSNEYKIQQWENNRRQKVFRNYYKDIRDATPTGTFKFFSFNGDIKEEKGDIKEEKGDIKKEEQIDEADSELGKFVKHPDLMKISNTIHKEVDKELADRNKSKNNAFWKAKQEFRKVQIEKLHKVKKDMKAKEEKKLALEKYKKKKTENFKKLNRKTKRGQPVMTGRLELLLHKIQSAK